MVPGSRIARSAVASVLCAGLVLLIASGVLVAPAGTAAAAGTAASPPSAVAYLAGVMDQFNKALDVYTDAHAAGNHFVARGRMSSPGDGDAVPAMNEACATSPHAGTTCIEATLESTGRNWGGWYFMNGALVGDDTQPRVNWGTRPKAGLDLRGARTLTFWARGARGGERVEFFCFGIGRDPNTGKPTAPYPDSARKLSTGYVSLTTRWRQYKISLTGADLSYVLGGFGWVSNAISNGRRDVKLYIDDIAYDKARPSDLRLLVSYQTQSSGDFDIVMRNTAFTYDNALALLAFLAAKDYGRAKMLADALVYAQQHDRYYTDGRVRNAYQGGDLVLWPGWTPNGKTGTARMPGWYEAGTGEWVEDEMAVSTYTGNVAWAMLGLLRYYEAKGGSQYLDAAKRMGEWVERNCRDTRGAGGYTAGFAGWEPDPTKLTYKSTEHNIDLLAAFSLLRALSGDRAWRARADYAKAFVLAMWDAAEGKFWTGTGDDGVTVNQAVVPLDVQAWAILALKNEGLAYRAGLAYAEGHHQVGAGFDFNQDRDGIWYEGTAHMAMAYRATGQMSKRLGAINALHAAQLRSGALNAASIDGLTTGFFLADGSPWLYFRRPHVGATAWLYLAERSACPF